MTTARRVSPVTQAVVNAYQTIFNPNWISLPGVCVEVIWPKPRDWPSCRGDRLKVAASRRRKVSVVEEVEELGPELHVEVLREFSNRDFLNHGEIKVD